MVRAPGIYFEKADLAAQPASVRSDVAGFVGLAVRGPVDTPVAIDSHTQFETIFGPMREDLHLGWCVRGFFENGGIRAWICRAAAPDAATASAIVSDSNGPALRIEASSPGTWGGGLGVTLSEATRIETLATGPVLEERAAPVAETTEFARGDLVRLSQPGGVSALRVVNRVDHADGWISWAAGDPVDALPTDAALPGIDPTRPLLLTRLRYDVSVSHGGVFAALTRDLGIVPGGPRYIVDVLAGQPGLLRVVDLRVAAGSVPLTLPTAPLDLSGGRDGLATLHIDDMLRALHAYDKVGEPAIFVMPDLHDPAPLPARNAVPRPTPDPCLDCPPPPPVPAVTPDIRPETPPGFDDTALARAQHALLDWCAARPMSFALLDMPRRLATAPSDSQRLLAWRRRFDSAFGALYHPWLAVPRAGRNTPARATPAAGHVAGQMAATDLADGIHVAPANRQLSWAQAASLDIRPEAHGLLNEAGINILRTTPRRGLRILGARTLSTDPAWLFIPVRRLVSMIGHALSLSSRWAVFEANNHATRAKLAAVYFAYLEALWRRGALAGAEPAEAFFVRAAPTEDEATTGRLTMIVGVAPLNPLEFIIFRIGREDGSVRLETDSIGRIQGAA